MELDHLSVKYKFIPRNILHVGAHRMQELDMYLKCGAEKIHWIEANPKIVEDLLSRGYDSNTNQITCAAISDVDGKTVSFNITNNEQSSSLLELYEHKKSHPDIYVEEEIPLTTTTLDTIIKSSILEGDIDLLVMDIQGAELLAVNGGKNVLKGTDYIMAEVNEREMYKECCLIDEFDVRLKDCGFVRLETHMTCWGWGDAFYGKCK